MAKTHFIGIGGIGMSALAHILLDRGEHVSGTDPSNNARTKALRAQGALIASTQDGHLLHDQDLVVTSTSIAADNTELQKARERKLDIIHRSHLLQNLTRESQGLAITGSHGKTTSSALLTHVLQQAHTNPSYAIGGVLKTTGRNGAHGKGPYFVYEACESDQTLLKYHPQGAILTRMNPEHLENYQDFDHLLRIVTQFSTQVHSQDLLFFCGDCPHLQKLGIQGTRFGLGSDNDIRAEQIRPVPGGWKFTLIDGAHTIDEVFLQSFLQHNIVNALGVYAMSSALGVASQTILQAFANFPGVARRMEPIFSKNHCQVLSDYGHHPYEIESTLHSIKTHFCDEKLVVVFEPHRPSRIRETIDAFRTCFAKADEVVITDIYLAGEEEDVEWNGASLAQWIQTHHRGVVRYCPHDQLASCVFDLAKPFTTITYFSAGPLDSFMKNLDWHTHNPTLNLGLFYGGKTVEHHISIQSAHTVRTGLSQPWIRVSDFFIPPNGRVTKPWHTLEQLDIAFPLIHGPLGEDGTLQGMFSFLGIPHLGPSFRSCAIAMDKAHTKALLEYGGIATAPYHVLDSIDDPIPDSLTYPLFVKPAHLGSSLGISYITSSQQLPEALATAFAHDHKVLLETAIEGRELEFVGIESTIYPPGEILLTQPFYDHEKKYGKHPTPTTTQAKLPETLLKQGLAIAQKTQKILELENFYRIDMFLTPQGKFFVNEINPLPGWTPISLLPQIGVEQHQSLENLLTLLCKKSMRRALNQQQLLPTIL